MSTTNTTPDPPAIDVTTYFIPPQAPPPPGPPPPPPPGGPSAQPPTTTLGGGFGAPPSAADLLAFIGKRKNPPPAEVKRQRDTTFDNTDNSAHEWLVYETVFNHDQFQRSPERRPIGAYSIPLNKLTVLLSSSVSDAVALEFCNAFFPGLTAAELKALAFRPGVQWQEAEFTKFAGSKQAHMPYNQLLNDPAAPALGTLAKPTEKSPAMITRLVGEWPIWQTASRSCIIRLTPSGSWVNDPDKVDDGKPLHWPFHDASNRDFKPPVATPGIPGSGPLPVSQLAGCYSIKTGVVWVGKINQASADSGDKGRLEPESLVAHLRSEYFNALDAWFQTRPSGAPLRFASDLIVLPEVLTVTYRDDTTKPPTGGGDGFQLRDLSRLKPTCKYFPPLSISYTGVRQTNVVPTQLKDKVYLDKYQPRFSALKELFTVSASGISLPEAAQKSIEWYGYWSTNFAGRIGTAKALLHICYGVQALTPNAQNFLLEYQADNTPTRRVAVRDLLDMRLHSDWVSTIFNPGSKVTSSITDLKGLFTKSNVPSDALKRVLEYEAAMQGDKFETFADKNHPKTGKLQYYKGTQLNWFPYTSLIRGSQVAVPSDLASNADPRLPGWQNALYANTTWGLTHALEYIRVLRLALDINITRDQIENIPLCFGTLAIRDLQAAGIKFKSSFTEDSKTGKVTYTEVVVKKVAEDKDDDDAKKPFLFRANALDIVDLPDTPEGYARAGQLYTLFEQWERRVSAIIHEKLYSDEGRAELRKFHGL